MRKIFWAAVFLVLAGCSSSSKPRPVSAPPPTPARAGGEELKFKPGAPFVALIPRGDGNALTIRIKGAAAYRAIEAKVRYQTAEGRLQGFFKTLKPAGEDVVEGEGIFGTCSKGVCKYDRGVKAGSLELAFRDGAGKEFFWRTKFVIKLARAGEDVRSADGKFTFTPEEARPVVIHRLLGMPDQGAAPYKDYAYGVFTPRGKAAGGVSWSFFDLPEEFADLEVVYWDGEAWQSAPTNRDKMGKTLTASVNGQIILLREP